MILQTNNVTETQKAGEGFAKKLLPGNSVLLYGNLGAGKTTFMQGLAKGLGIAKRIISPTFIIVRSYEVKEEYSSSKARSSHSVRTIKKLYHVDLYRTQTIHDLESVGLPEILQENDAVVAIEWPEKLGSLLPKNRWELHFQTIDENRRKITIEKFKLSS